MILSMIFADTVNFSQNLIAFAALITAIGAVVSNRINNRTTEDQGDKTDWREGMKSLVTGAQADSTAAKAEAKQAKEDVLKCHEECSKLRSDNNTLNLRIGMLEIENGQLRSENQHLNERITRLEATR